MQSRSNRKVALAKATFALGRGYTQQLFHLSLALRQTKGGLTNGGPANSAPDSPAGGRGGQRSAGGVEGGR